MTARLKVSFIVPTLNRGRYVIRAVDSCINQTAADVDIEVIVLDSMSDDGSWELLTTRFSKDGRVILAQNQRGLGPTRSWLDGARLVTGEFVTFIWSDDYISPLFLEVLLPPLLKGHGASIGKGAIRNIDDERALPVSGHVTSAFNGDKLFEHYLGLVSGSQLPVSPAAALFARGVFDRWIAAVESWCTHPGVRNDLMWQRAIGPDLMLFLAAGEEAEQKVSVHENVVAQFSSHSNSITISSSTWLLRAGYWLANWWAIQRATEQRRPVALSAIARLTLLGVLFGQLARYTAGMNPSLLRSFDEQVSDARQCLFSKVGACHGSILLFRSATQLLWRVILSLFR
ncbi:glycosyltransferase [Novosphingobium sp. G106]|uniref:glycosyltransferase family 2 protein n=1 Tax=Novosphingobium sp. G106 TaxID=2849500 RepID=UPI001C2D9B2D|nr:glycosyltransferase family 2 protein [Novosphingobium sp. G106]MBV1689342.1 glycosyltransferase [Novosphingobium sp. G106]